MLVCCVVSIATVEKSISNCVPGLISGTSSVTVTVRKSGMASTVTVTSVPTSVEIVLISSPDALTSR
jgi:hypothetical protein